MTRAYLLVTIIGLAALMTPSETGAQQPPTPAEVPPPSPPAPAAAATLLSGFTQDVIVTAMTEPTALAFLPDGRILIAEHSGRIYLVSDGRVVTFLDLRGRVNSYGDRGLLAIAVDPDFSTNGSVYVLYTYEHDPDRFTGPKTGRLSRFTAFGDGAPLSSEVVLLGSRNGNSCNDFPVGADCIPADVFHMGGDIVFAPDGSLMVSTGDGGGADGSDQNALRSQDLDSLAGKVLRIKPNGAGLSTNPFWTGNADANRSKVWAYGLRNPFRMTLRPGGLVPYIADVGESTWDEINVGVAGANFGWPCYEGTDRQAGFDSAPACQALFARGPAAIRLPLISVPHFGRAAALTGGVFYTGTAFPPALRGAYFYGDYVRGVINYLTVDSENRARAIEGFVTAADGPVAFAVRPDGHLYYLSITTGQLRRIRYTGPPPPPNVTTYLSDLPWAGMTNGWGPAERDRANGDVFVGDGQPLALNDRVYARGLGTHAPADVRYRLDSACTSFIADVGVDDEVGDSGSVVFQVWTDGFLRYDSGVMTGKTPARGINLPIAGVRELALVVLDGGDGNNFDHADWADARILCGPQPEFAAPVVTSVTPAPGATDVSLSPLISATFSAAMNAATLNSATVTLAPRGTTIPLPAGVIYDPTTLTVRLIGNAPLQPNVAYVVTVKGGAGGAQDLAGRALAGDVTWTFTTVAPVRAIERDQAQAVFDLQPPRISSISVVEITASTATIVWTTNEPADTQVEFGTTPALGNATPLNRALVTHHEQQLTGLRPGTVYHIRVRSRDAAGNLATATATFMTIGR